MKNLHSKIATIALAILSVVCFFNMDVFDGKHLTGADLFRYGSEDAPMWPFLFITIPIFVALIRFAINVEGEKTKSISIGNACLMLIPVIALNADFDNNCPSFGSGIIMYWLCTIAIIVIALVTKTDDTPEDNGKNAINIKKEDIPLKLRKQYDEAQLREVVSNPALYKASLVEACKKELQIREDANNFMEEVRNYPDDKIGQILASRDTYSDAIVFCCQKVRAERLAEQRKAEASKREEEKQRLIQEEKEKQEKRDAWWKKNRKYFIVGALILILLVDLVIVMSREDQSETENMEITVGNNADNNADQDVSEYDEFQSDDEEYMSYGFYDVACGRLLDEADIADCTKGELRIMRNWIYARHGYIFKSQDLRDYFSKFGWYEPRYSDVSSLLSDVEKKNVEFIKRHE
ncbi:MAG: YARHG domain-containing protein [Bacteroidaceae bacterium]|nr:YARHG domain-containing protein [Bacteroidaceae bacterium]